MMVNENQYYRLRYEIIPDTEFIESAKKLVEIIPNEGVLLFEISATYAKQHPVSSYYVFGMNERDARRRFKKYLSSIGIIETVREVKGKEEESILRNPRNFLIV